jgi:uncharacterized protein with HEPN domain
MRERDYESYVEDIIEHMSYAEEFIKSMSFEEFANDKKTVLSVTKCIEIVGEATKRIPDSIREKYPEIPWRDMAGIRDRLVHGYFKVNLEIVWMTVTIEFPELRPKMEEVLSDVDL